MADLLKKKTTWVGIVMAAASLIESWFDADGRFVFDFAAIFDPQVLAGAALITGRHALMKGAGK